MQKHRHRNKTIDPPPDIQQLAKKEELGELRKIYTASKLGTNAFSSGAICLFLGGIWLFFWGVIVAIRVFPPPTPYEPTIDIGLSIAPGIPACLLLIIGLYLTLSRRLYSPWHIYLWQRGFIYEKKQTHKVFRWNQITTVKASPIVYDPYGRPFYTCNLSHQDGYQIKLENGFLRAPELLDIVLTEVAYQLSQQELKIVSPDRAKAFAHVEFNQHGISDAQETLFWSSMQEVVIKNGLVNVLKKEIPEGKRQSPQKYEVPASDFSEERFD